jgi:nickel and cobalt resistance protein CnrR
MQVRLAPLLAAAVLGGAVGAVGGSWLMHEVRQPPSNLHDVIHTRFALTPAEAARLEAAERGYDARRATIERRLRIANLRLANAISADPRMSPEVQSASSEVESAAAELQSATLAHIFEMRAALEPAHRAQYDSVLVRALSRQP